MGSLKLNPEPASKRTAGTLQREGCRDLPRGGLLRSLQLGCCRNCTKATCAGTAPGSREPEASGSRFLSCCWQVPNPKGFRLRFLSAAPRSRFLLCCSQVMRTHRHQCTIRLFPLFLHSLLCCNSLPIFHSIFLLLREEPRGENPTCTCTQTQQCPPGSWQCFPACECDIKKEQAMQPPQHLG